MKGTYTAYRACPCCGGHTVTPFVEWSFPAEEITLSLGTCCKCDMVYVTNSNEVDMSNQQFTSWEPGSDTDPINVNNIKRAHNENILALVEPLLSTGARVLDYGAGYCGFLNVAKAAGYEVEGINPCVYLADWSKRTFDIDVYPVFGKDFNPGRKYNLIVSDQTFEHLESPLTDLVKVKSLLEKNGIAYINVPNLKTYRRLSHGTDCLKDICHYNYFANKNLVQLCNKTGLKVLAVAPTIERGKLKRSVKTVLNHLGMGDCSVLVQNTP